MRGAVYARFCAVLVFKALSGNRPKFLLIIGFVISRSSMNFRSEGLLTHLRGIRVLRRVSYNEHSIIK